MTTIGQTVNMTIQLNEAAFRTTPNWRSISSVSHSSVRVKGCLGLNILSALIIIRADSRRVLNRSS